MLYTIPHHGLRYNGKSTRRANIEPHRCIEDESHSAVDVRTDNLIQLRELGPPDLVHLTKQSSKSSTKQVRAGFWLNLPVKSSRQL